ncbi:hypothetical protein HOT57_gp29 [Pseudomonas phage phCDa]|uniref:Uncharacterized protein n=1 Tax=Pseudomonas phage phCDa TaxID=2268587 RepID=A0A2Z5H8Z5_9CAUD|nr:hypothetical protein HOT57_gp29 [Pseudomonas phage phCDa]AXC36473.1 hypothetical protein phCDa_29 [Pseudomonas phage phCDa]
MEYVLFNDGYVVAIDDSLEYSQLLAILTTVEGAVGYYWKPGSEYLWRCISPLSGVNETTEAVDRTKNTVVDEPPDVIKLAIMLS